MRELPPSVPRRVLVIDDNTDAAETLVAILNILGHVAVLANDGKTGISIAESFGPDVVFLDIGMPEMNGFEVASLLRKMFGAKSVRIVALTGWKDAEPKRRAFQSGFDLHLCKPAPIQDIAEILEAA